MNERLSKVITSPYPSFVIRPNVGFRPTVPHKDEGILMDPVLRAQ